jgi:hypothetical protein
MRKLLFMIVTGIIVLSLSRSEVAAAEAKTSSTPPSAPAAAVKPPPGRSAEKQPTPPAKPASEASRDREQATGPDRDKPMLRLLWLLTGSSKSR